MKLLTPFLALAALCASVSAEDKNLFNGKDLTGWKGLDFWSVEDGVITGRTTKEKPTKGNTFLVYKDEVADFELTFKYKIIGGNSGVQYRSKLTDEKAFVVAGYQADFEAGKGQHADPPVGGDRLGAALAVRRTVRGEEESEHEHARGEHGEGHGESCAKPWLLPSVAVSLAVSLAVSVRCVCLHGAEVSNFPFRIGTLARMLEIIDADDHCARERRAAPQPQTPTLQKKLHAAVGLPRKKPPGTTVEHQAAYFGNILAIACATHERTQPRLNLA